MKLIQKIVTTFLFITLSQIAVADVAIGVFDLNRALFETDAWKVQSQRLQQEFAEEQATVDGLRNELEELFANLETNAVTLTETEIQRLREEGQFKQLKIQQIGERVQASLRESQNNFLERYRNLLGEALNDVYSDGAFDLILRAESVVLSGFTFDVTPKVTAKLNDLIASAGQ